MFATVHRDEDTEPAEYPEAVPRPGSESTETSEGGPRATAEEGASPVEIMAFLSSPS
jgi:hypothetical protein